MSLFIGNVSKKVTAQKFEDAFKSYGNCKIDLRVISKLSRKDMHLFNTIVRDALKKRNRLSKIPILVDSDSISNGLKTQEGSTKTTK